ncbi:MAG: type II secretion system protein GspM [Thermodesulfovibrionales bacterium]
MKRNRIIFVGIPLILILLCLVLYEYGYLRVQSEITSIKEEQAVKMKTLEKYNALIYERPQLERELNRLKETRKAEDSKLIEGQTLSLAAATLQDMVKGIIVGRGGTISSERVGKPEDRGKFKVISVSIDAVLPDARALGDILYSIETRTPYLVVKELDTRVRDYRNPKELMVKLDVSALTTAK